MCILSMKIGQKKNKILQIYNSLTEAAKSVEGQSANITLCCSPKYPNNKTYKGYKWSYIEDIHFGTYEKELDKDENI